MVITQLEARVAPEKTNILKAAFDRGVQHMPSAIEQSYLVQDRTDQEIWRVITVWKSREALQGYRQSVETPEGVLMFQEAGAEPALTISDVIGHS
jgi:quinol monooxygenase YgiN